MKIYIHTDLTAVEDMHYKFQIGEYYRLPIKGWGKIESSKKTDMYIRRDKDYAHKVNAKLFKKVDKTIEGTTNNLLTGDVGAYNEWNGLAYFQIEIELFRSFYFFVQYSAGDKSEFESLSEGAYYYGSVTFSLTCGIMDSIVNGLWDEFEIPHPTESWKRYPYGLVEIQEIITDDGIEVHSTDEIYTTKRESNTFIVGCDWLFNRPLAKLIFDPS